MQGAEQHLLLYPSEHEVPLQALEPLIATLTEYQRHKRVLLVLDNSEQIRPVAKRTPVGLRTSAHVISARFLIAMSLVTRCSGCHSRISTPAGYPPPGHDLCRS